MLRDGVLGELNLHSRAAADAKKFGAIRALLFA